MAARGSFTDGGGDLAGPDVPFGVGSLLEELRELHGSDRHVRQAFRQERQERRARLVQLEYELRAEEQFSRDMTQRIETLEPAITDGRRHFDSLMRDEASDAKAGILAAASTQRADGADAVQPPSSSETSCREVLLESSLAQSCRSGLLRVYESQ